MEQFVIELLREESNCPKNIKFHKVISFIQIKVQWIFINCIAKLLAFFVAKF